MMNVLLRISDGIDSFRQRAGRNVFWLVLVAALAAGLVVPLYLFQESESVAVREPVSKGAVRPAPPAVAAAPVAPPPAAPTPGATASALAAPPPAAPKPAPVQPPAPSDERKPEASPAPAAASSEPQRLYQVQLGAFAAEPRAHRLARRAARAGFPSVVIPVTVGDKVLHRVRVRDALPKEQAEALKSNVKQKIPTLEPVLMVSGS